MGPARVGLIKPIGFRLPQLFSFIIISFIFWFNDNYISYLFITIVSNSETPSLVIDLSDYSKKYIRYWYAGEAGAIWRSGGCSPHVLVFAWKNPGSFHEGSEFVHYAGSSWNTAGISIRSNPLLHAINNINGFVDGNTLLLADDMTARPRENSCTAWGNGSTSACELWPLVWL